VVYDFEGKKIDEMEKSKGDFERLLLKNSWGTGKNEFGKEIKVSGNYFVTKDYLMDSLQARQIDFLMPPGY
jgi:hypothetical protein